MPQNDGVIWLAREADPGCSGRVDPMDVTGHCRSHISAAAAACAFCGLAQQQDGITWGRMINLSRSDTGAVILLENPPELLA